MAKRSKSKTPGELLVCRNPKASKLYELEEKLEAGLVLMGSEVKSLRDRQANLEGAYAAAEGGNLLLHKMHIAPYEAANAFGHEPKRSRRLLLHRREIDRWADKLATGGYTIVPLAVYFRKGYAKVELALARGKKAADRRQELKRRQDMLEARAAMAKGRGG